MRILGFDTATRATAVALCDFDVAGSTPDAGPNPDASLSGAVELEARDDPRPGERPRHATRLMASIVELLHRAGMEWDEVDRIAVGVGPGSFTGLRIGVATARALGQARAIELVAVSTLQSLALGARPHALSAGTDAVLAVLDARRGEVFAAGWSLEMQPLLAPRALTPQALAELLGELPAPVLTVGDGAIQFRSTLGCSGEQIPEDDSELHRVTAISHCRLARTARASAPDEILPDYLRLPDAEIARRAAGPR